LKISKFLHASLKPYHGRLKLLVSELLSNLSLTLTLSPSLTPITFGCKWAAPAQSFTSPKCMPRPSKTFQLCALLHTISRSMLCNLLFCTSLLRIFLHFFYSDHPFSFSVLSFSNPFPHTLVFSHTLFLCQSFTNDPLILQHTPTFTYVHSFRLTNIHIHNILLSLSLSFFPSFFLSTYISFFTRLTHFHICSNVCCLEGFWMLMFVYWSDRGKTYFDFRLLLQTCFKRKHFSF
jgi:hypothetical protein